MKLINQIATIIALAAIQAQTTDISNSDNNPTTIRSSISGSSPSATQTSTSASSTSSSQPSETNLTSSPNPSFISSILSSSSVSTVSSSNSITSSISQIFTIPGMTNDANRALGSHYIVVLVGASLLAIGSTYL